MPRECTPGGTRAASCPGDARCLSLAGSCWSPAHCKGRSVLPGDTGFREAISLCSIIIIIIIIISILILILLLLFFSFLLLFFYLTVFYLHTQVLPSLPFPLLFSFFSLPFWRKGGELHKWLHGPSCRLGLKHNLWSK